MSLASLFTHRHSIRRHIGRLAMSTSPAPMPPHATNTTSRPQPATTTTSPTQPATNTTSLPPMTPAPSTSLSPPPTSNSPSSPPATHYLPPPQSLPMGVIVGIVIGGVWITLVIILGPLYFYFKKKKRTDLPVYDCPPPDDPYDLQPQHWQPNTPQPGSHAVKIPPMPSPPHAAMSWPPPSPGLPPTIRPPSPPLMSSNRDSGSNYTGGENPLTPPSPGVALGFSKRRFTYEELAKATDNFSKANFLGQGGFGFVHKGILLNGKEVAIKKRKEGSDQGEREFQVEVDIISRVHHRHVVTLVGYCISGSHRMLVYEFVPNKTLEFHLHGKGSTNMDWPTRRKSALGAAKGLAYLHEDCHPKIIHRDIKAANILMDSNFEAKVADFGLAKECPSNAGTHIFTEPKGTYGYLAPEYALSGILTDKADVYAFGVMLLELITGRRPLFSSPSSTMVSLAYWATPLLKRALKNGNFDGLVDPRLQNEYNHNEMVRMVTCAACCVKTSAQHRPQMSQVVLALEGHLSLSDLNAEILGDSSASISHGSSDYDTNSGRTTLGHDGTNL